MPTIAQLPIATLLGPTDVVPISQNGVTRSVSISQLGAALMAQPNLSPAFNNPQFTGTGYFGDTLPYKITTLGQRGPLFILNDFKPDGVTSGRAAGLSVWIGNNPTLTPGPIDSVAFLNYIDNLDGRSSTWNADLVSSRFGAADGGTTGAIRNLELEMLDRAGYAPDPFNSATGRSVGIEYVVRAGSINHATCCSFTWAVDPTGIAWWGTGHILSRVAHVGIKFVKNPGLLPGGTVDGAQAFDVAAIHDASDSAAVLKVSGSHVDLINMTDGFAGTFFRGPSNAPLNAAFRNFADYSATLYISSGSTKIQQSKVSLCDGDNEKWWLLKNYDNSFGVYNTVTNQTSIAVSPADLVTLAVAPPSTATGNEVATASFVLAHAGTGTGTSSAPVSRRVAVAQADLVLTAADANGYVMVNLATPAPASITLLSGMAVTIIAGPSVSTANPITVSPNSAATIVGQPTLAISNAYDSFPLQPFGTPNTTMWSIC